jgi:murein DD-endopeptidase MepM/ murein hydrolase activator NlpD
MDVTTPALSVVPAATPAPAAPGLSAADRAKVKQFAHDFEALLMTQMLKQMRQSMLTDEDESQGYGSATMTDTIDSELGSALARTGGVGIAAIMTRALDRQQGAAPASSAGTGTPAVSPATPAVAIAHSASAAPDVTTPAGVVTSGFGWRADPLTGQTRFHTGTDIRLAYGQDVHAAAGGRVSFAGEQGGYGQTVVIDHGNGVQTRYAHLSGYAVRAGDPVDSGQVLGRSGNSGRTTGPHLHFEVLRDGRAVDPSALTAEPPKVLAASTDYAAYTSAQ